ncbi:MAG: PAS domain S-box protein [Candidatus Magnetominusculus sp. LBB02]|nr:PAS domain S-box protein [Candidatus Magnetominusculus sp. LBB02]
MNKSALNIVSSSIQAKMSVFISLLIIIVTVSLFVFTDLVGVPFTDIESDYEESFNSAISGINQIADTRKDNINKKILSLTANIETIVSSSMTKSYVEGSKPLEGNQEFANYLENYRKTYNIFDNIQVADLKNGKIIAATRTVDIGMDVSYQYYVKGAVKSRCYHICFALDPADGDTDLYISHVIDVNSQPRYVIIMNVNASDFLEALNSNTQRGDNTESVLTDQDGVLLINLKHPLADGKKAVPLGAKFFSLDSPIMARVLEANEGTVIGNDYRGVKVLAAYRYIPIDAETGWALVIQRDYADVLAPYHYKIRYVIILIIVYLLASLILTQVMIRWLTRPILTLKKAACEIGSGNLNTVVTIKTKDELGQLAKTFNKMVRDLKEGQAELNRRRDFLQKVLDNTTNAVYSIDPSGKFLLANYKVSCITGYTAEELLGLPFLVLFDSEALPGVTEKFIKASVVGQRVANYETKLIRKDGVTRIVSFTITPLIDNEKIDMVIGTAEDITERRQLEELRRVNEKRLEIMVALSQLADKPANEIMNFVLEKTIDLTGSTIGFIAFGNEDDTEYTVSAFSTSVMKECAVKGADLRFQREHSGLWGEAVRRRSPVIVNDYETTELFKKGYPDGHMPLKNLLLVPTFDGNRIVMVTAVANKDGQYSQTDISQLTILMDGLWQLIERKRLTDELRRLNHSLIDKVVEETQRRQQGEQLLTQQSKMAAMGEMIGMIAHQWKQPLNVIAVTAQDLSDAYNFGEMNAGYLANSQATIAKHVEFMLDTIDDFRKFLRPSKEKVLFDVKKAVEELTAMFAPYFVKDNIVINVISEDSGTLYSATGYPNEFKQVILNIINNARDAVLSKRGQTGQAGKDTININVYKDSSEKIIITISDTGGGIPEDIINKIFDSHFTTKPSHIGTGIGLYMSKTIIETNMGWRLTVRNIEGGAEFRIEI